MARTKPSKSIPGPGIVRPKPNPASGPQPKPNQTTKARSSVGPRIQRNDAARGSRVGHSSNADVSCDGGATSLPTPTSLEPDSAGDGGEVVEEVDETEEVAWSGSGPYATSQFFFKPSNRADRSVIPRNGLIVIYTEPISKSLYASVTLQMSRLDLMIGLFEVSYI
jgi:hypothetical protein